MSNTRKETVFIITRWLVNRDFPDRLIESGPDRGFITDMTYTTIRRYASLMWVLEQFMRKVPKGETLAALLLGAAQIMFMDDVTDYAAVNETVEAAKARSRASVSLINGVLRNIVRSREKLLRELEKQPLSIRKSHPEELVRRWMARYTSEEVEKLCDWNNTPAETFITGRPDDNGQSRFEKVPRGTGVSDIPGFREGEFIVQDPATATAIELLELRPGLSVLDGCAAPGGKTVQIAWRADESKILALDLREDRITTIRENLRRTGLEHVEVEQTDLTLDLEDVKRKHGLFDRVLLDVPCSNSGVLRRRPDARWRWSEKRLKRLIRTQRSILNNTSKLLKHNGILVYSTCSLEPEENSLLVERFIKDNPEFASVSSVEKLPFNDGTDGAFACAIKRRAALKEF
ncbi:MAG: transcription antitermination factor NusB [Kiritimatiellia bacterium]